MANPDNKVYFEATKLPMLKKKGIITPDEDGYYELVVGGLNTFNNTNAWYYTLEEARKIFGPGTIFQRRVANGCLRAEVNHPKRRPGETDASFTDRMLDVDRDNVCAHFKKVWLDENFGKNRPEYNNPGLVAIMALVKPSLPKGDMLKESLDNPNENTCFSIRATAREEFIRGRRVRTLQEIISIDFVNEGGILIASKWDSPATESIDNSASVKLTRDILDQIRESSKGCMATESTREIADYLNDKYFKPATQPIWAKW